jgi:hypothetical protein
MKETCEENLAYLYRARIFSEFSKHQKMSLNASSKFQSSHELTV